MAEVSQKMVREYIQGSRDMGISVSKAKCGNCGKLRLIVAHDDGECPECIMKAGPEAFY